MPTVTPDQGLSLPVGADVADNPAAFTNFVAGTEVRLVRLYTNEADRTARMLVVAENELSGLAAEDRIDVYNGAAHVSLYRRTMFSQIRLTADQALTPSSTVLQNVTNMVVALPTAGTFRWRSTMFYDASTTADFKFAYTIPAAATMRWGISALGTAGTTPSYTTATASAAALSIGALGVGTVTMARMEGDITMGGTAGNLQMQAAQNTSDATNVNIFSRSYLEIWRVL